MTSLRLAARRPSEPSEGEARRGWLEPHEAAFVLEKSVREVLRMLRTGELLDVRCARRRGIDLEDLARLLGGR